MSVRLLDDFYLHRELSPAVPSGEETTPFPVSLTPSSRASRQCGARFRRGVEEEEQLDTSTEKSIRLFQSSDKRTKKKRREDVMER